MRIGGINARELTGGLLTAALGAFAAWEASRYFIGELTDMGPGYFPLLLALLLIGLGGLLVLEGLKADAEPAELPAWRSLIFVLAGIGAFALLLERAGLAPASAALVLIASLAEPRIRPPTTIALAIVVAAISVLVFTRLIGMPLPAFARWW